MEIKKYATKYLPIWTKAVPFQIKGIAIKEACEAFWDAKGKPEFRSRKNPEQSCFIPKTALGSNGIYPRISGKGLKFHESLPEFPMDSRLIWRYEKWWISVPFKQTIPRSENQASGIVATNRRNKKYRRRKMDKIAGRVYGRQRFSRSA
jgi:putative transposase